jgi:hypothetical protein
LRVILKGFKTGYGPMKLPLNNIVINMKIVDEDLKLKIFWEIN